MPSTDRRVLQGGVALVEAVVALALLAIGVTVGLTGVDTASAGAREMVYRGHAQCMARSEAQYVWRAPYAGSYSVPAPDLIGYLKVDIDSAGTGVAGLQMVTISYLDKASGGLLIQPITLLKAQGMSDQNAASGQVGVGC